MIDLTEITDKVTRSYWERLPGRPPYDTLTPPEKTGLKQALIPLINETALLTEAAVREQITVFRDRWWDKSQRDHTIIRDAGIMQDICDDLARTFNLEERE